MAPISIAEIAAAIRGSPRVEAVDLSEFRRVLAHHPEDMTVTVQAGLPWADLGAALGEHDQWLPIDPPLAHLWTVRDVLDHGITGPRRCGHGLVRDHVLGLRVILANGEVIRTGGKVVKNVAGYDLTRMFVGARGSLGLIVEATFKTLPRPEAERFGQAQVQSLEQAEDLIAGISESDLNPTVLDFHNVPAAGERAGWWLVIGFAGAAEDVEEQMAQASAAGFSKASDLDHEKRFWEAAPAGGVQMISVLPSDLIKRLASLAPQFFVARAANGVIHYLGDPPRLDKSDTAHLQERLKKAFDPEGKFR